MLGVEKVLAATDPQKVFVDLDFFWATIARVDITSFLRHHAHCIRLGHIQDVVRGVVIPPKGFVDITTIPTSDSEDVGYGTIDYATLIPAGTQNGNAALLCRTRSVTRSSEHGPALVRRTEQNPRSLVSARDQLKHPNPLVHHQLAPERFLNRSRFF
jgi:hypothetical protein